MSPSAQDRPGSPQWRLHGQACQFKFVNHIYGSNLCPYLQRQDETCSYRSLTDYLASLSPPRSVSPLFFNHTPPRRATLWVWGAPRTNRTLHISRTSNPLSIMTGPASPNLQYCKSAVRQYHYTPLHQRHVNTPLLVSDIFCRHFLRPVICLRSGAPKPNDGKSAAAALAEIAANGYAITIICHKGQTLL